MNKNGWIRGGRVVQSAIAVIVFILFLSSCAGFQPAQVTPPTYPTWMVEADAPETPPGLHVTVDPRVELLAVVQSLSGYEKETGLITDFSFSYKQRIADTFAPYRDHAAVRLFDRMSRRGFSFDAPPTAMLYLSPPPELAVVAPFPNDTVARAGGPEALAEFLAALRDFAAQSDFMAFFDANQDYYRQIEAATTALIRAEDLDALEAYFGMRQHSYNIILASLFHPGGFGPRVPRPDGLYDVYSITGPQDMQDDLPVFGTPEDYRYLIWHEFSHSFINPLTSENADLVDPHAGLLDPIRQEMKNQAYERWETVVNEHVIRAITARLAAQAGGEPAGQDALAQERQRGFRYVDALAERLQEYESNRDQYPTMAEFYPRLMEVWPEMEGR